MKKNSSMIWGIILIIVGVILGGNSLNLFDVDLFFDGWWTLFIIIPCFIELFNDHDKKGNIIGLLTGVLLLLICNDLINFDLAFKLLIPMIIIIIGLSIICKNLFNNKFNAKVEEINAKTEIKDEYCSTFLVKNIKIENEEFNGTTINAIMGGFKLDLTDAIIKEDVVINTCSIFGGIDIIVPDYVAVKVKSNSIFGGVDNKKKSDKDTKVTIYLNATCVFGGVDIK